ncbi:hypothetical protein GCM10007094_23250 [Pseudovibrio japonicus]|uniref:RNase H type-1 domain-containing protein n=1 Tax=Pseudovibrio japonicus TaxID=366534 RepID=A0ABQ3EEF7_9HYPH|nr:RNase H family protein [Pseudovibrio japonicus]GHB33751.1 hypothetical protein GCM10007094_23250 [Pseudovibrio japonicus]
MKPDVTVFTDASLSHHNKSCGYGFWAKGDGRPAVHGGGPFQAFHGCIEVNELKALANAMSALSADQYFSASDKVILLQSDSVPALACLLQFDSSIQINSHKASAEIKPQRKPMKKIHRRISALIVETAAQHNLELTLRHVRGHQKGDGRNYVNRLCDKLAKAGRKQFELDREARKLEGQSFS